MKPFPLLLILFVALLYPAAAQTERKANGPTLSVAHHGWTTTGELVLGVRLEARGEPVRLGGYKARRGRDGSDESEERPFTTSICYLTAAGLDQRIPALSRLPSKPFFGTGRVIDQLNPGQSITLGVAFGKLPPLPVIEGKTAQEPAHYQLTLHVPGIGQVDFALPVTSNP